MIEADETYVGGKLHNRHANKRGDPITPDTAEWAYSIRDLGNEATHDETEPSKEDVDDLAAFTRVVLEYLYLMPAKVARRANHQPTEATGTAGGQVAP